MSRPVDPGRQAMPLEAWPANDRARWARALEPADPLDDEVGFASSRWKPNTIASIASGYGHWLTWLQRNEDLDPSTAPAERATEDRLRAYLAHMSEMGVADYTKAGRLQQLGNALRAMNPASDVSRILKASNHIHNKAKPVRDVVGRLQPAAEVEKLGLEMMHAAEHDRFRTASERAVLYRDGLLIAFLVHRPVRMANLAAITIGDHLQRRGECWWLSMEGDEVKNGERIDCTWPAVLTGSLDRYLDVHRPVLQSGSQDSEGDRVGALWVALGGRAMGRSAIQVQIKTRTQAEFGKSIFPHAFRHLAATTIAKVDPENIQAASAVLGHKSPKMTEEHYNRAKMVDAGDRYHKALETQPGRTRAPSWS